MIALVLYPVVWMTDLLCKAKYGIPGMHVVVNLVYPGCFTAQSSQLVRRANRAIVREILQRRFPSFTRPTLTLAEAS